MGDTTEQDQAEIDPAQAFEALRAEVGALRRVMESLPEVLEDARAPDYGSELGHMAKSLATAATKLEAIEKHPALRLTPEQHQAAVARAGEGLMRDALQKLDRATQEAERERHQLARMISTIRGKREQRNWLIYTGLVAFVLALLLSPFLYAALPFGLNGRVAALVMNTDRWNAGEALMKADSPDGWQNALNAWNLVRTNQKEIAACSEEAGKTKRDQHCTVIPPAIRWRER